MSVQVSIDLSGMDARMQRVATTVKNPARPLMQWASWYGADRRAAFDGVTFEKLDSSGMDVRGSWWPAVGPQYIRKTGPAQDRRVPQWGGVARIAGAVDHFSSDVATGRKNYRRKEKVYGTVRGKKRPSGKRVTRASRVGGDTGQMFREFTRNPSLSADRRTVTLSTSKRYAGRFNKRRPFATINQNDRIKFNEFVRAWLSLAVK